MKKTLLYLGVFSTIALLAGCATTTKLIPPPKNSYGLSTYSSYNGDPIIIESTTPTVEYNKRIYYFQDESGMKKFNDNPVLYLTKYPFNELPKIISPLQSDYGLRTDCSYNGAPIVVGQFTPALMYLQRIYYFAHKESRELFMGDPMIYVAKYPANKVPTIISPLKSAYGTKTICAATGIPILVGPHTPTLEYVGRIFYFSNLVAMDAFKKDPQAYIEKNFNQD
ncbi:MAG: hypothetical protein GY756_18620 [bacterium]|nr:hypothetical protein [bacterium]